MTGIDYPAEALSEIDGNAALLEAMDKIDCTRIVQSIIRKTTHNRNRLKCDTS